MTIRGPLVTAAATSAVTRSTDQMMLEMFRDHGATGVTTLFRKAAVLGYRRQMEKYHIMSIKNK
jgi:hypothetical protein